MSAAQVIAGRFEIADLEKDLLGRGGMGHVYRGSDLQTGQPVAIKALKPEVVASDPDMVARFIREGEALRQLDHPSIVKMVAAVEEVGWHYLVMEYVEGGSLRELLDRGALPVRRVLEISLDLADALTRAHRLEIIHRDLKPANVLLAKDGTPRLTGFGVAHVADNPPLTQSGMLMGTIDYLSPEACRGETLDGRTDIWAFGVILYEMLTGKRPFAGESITAVLLAILTEPVPDLSLHGVELPDALADLVYRTLEKDRRQRIPSVRLVGAELEALLQERVDAHSAQPGASRFTMPTPPRATGRERHNLPAQPTPFVGRGAELEAVAGLLADPGVRLLTILGPGGMGKTRLALETGAAQLGSFEHGVYFVSLAPLQTVEAIVPAVAEAVGLSFYADARGNVEANPQQQLLNYLRQKQLLLIMDNFEHLLDGVGVVNDILRAASDVKVLATSRARLNTQGEQAFYLSGMEFPDWETPEDALEYSAVKLFMQSARRVRPGFELQADDLRYISRICRLVQGMPLAILLAAAWVEMLSPAEIAGEIEKSADFLASDLRDVPGRQRSIRTVFDHSWNLLTGREREVFRALSVFCGGFTRQVAQEVAGASLRELMALVNKSLLRRTPAGRYEIHELLRQYAAEALDQSPALSETVRDRHCATYAAALEQWGKDLKGFRQRAALEEMDVEFENVRAAWNWAAEHVQVARLESAADGLWHFCAQRARYQEGEPIYQVAAERLALSLPQSPGAPGGGARVLARIWAQQTYFSFWLGHSDITHRLIQQSSTLLDEIESAGGEDVRRERALVLWRKAWMIPVFGAEIRRLHEQSLALYRALEDGWWTAQVLRDFAQTTHGSGCYDEARQFAEESLTIRRMLGDQIGVADSLFLLSQTAWVQGRLEESERLAWEGLAICQETGNLAAIAQGLRSVGESLIRLGRFAVGYESVKEAQAIYSDLGDPVYTVIMDLLLGEAQAHLEEYQQAHSHGQTAYTFFEGGGVWWGDGYSRYVLGLAALGMGNYAEAQRWLQEGLHIFQGIKHQENLGWVQALLGYVACKLGQPAQARENLSLALGTWTGIGAFMPLVYGLPAVALLLADEGEAERAVELYALASRYGFVANSRWFEDVAGRHVAAIAATLPPEAAAAAQERGRERDLGASVAELLAELEK